MSLVLGLHCDGSDGSTTFVDVCGHTVTANNNAQVDTAQSKFGGASALFDGTNDYLSIPNSADYNFGIGDFTIAGWIRPAAVTGANRCIISSYQDAANGFSLEINTSAKLVFNCSGNGVDLTGATSLSVDTWYFVEVSRSGTTLKLFLDGTQDASATDSQSITSTAQLTIGALFTGGSALDDYIGHIDDLIIDKGTAWHTSNYTAPTTAFAEPPILPSGLASAEAFGTPTIARIGPVSISDVGGIASAEAFGTATVTRQVVVSISGAGNIASAEAFGTPFVHPSIQEAISDTVSCSYTTSAVHPVRDEWVDAMSLAQTDSYSMAIATTLTQSLALSDRVGFYAEWLMQDTVNLTLTPAVAARFPFTLLDSLNVIPSASGALSFDLPTGDALALSDTLRAALALMLQDSMLVSYALAASLRLRLALADTTTLSDTLAPTTALQITLQDSADLGDSTVGTLNLYLTLRDGAVLEVLAEQDDASYLCLALNLALGGATTYEAYNFPYMAHFRGRTLLGNDQGLYEVAGSDDAGTPFHATFATGLMDFGDARAKRLQALYVGHDSEGETFIGTLSGNDRTARWYRLSPTDGDFQTERASTALGVAARYWAIEVDSIDSFEIDSIELRPVVTARKVRG